MFCVFGALALFNWSGPAGRWRFLWYPPVLLACWLLGSILSRGFTLPIERRLRRIFPSSPVSMAFAGHHPGNHNREGNPI
jgi:hypothetical protein